MSTTERPPRIATPLRAAWMATALAACLVGGAAAQTIDRGTAIIADPGLRTLPTRYAAPAPPPGPPPVNLSMRPYSPNLHQLTWDWDGVHGFSYYQVYKIDPQSPGGRLVRDRLTIKAYWDSSFVAPNTTTYRVVVAYPDGSQGSADYFYAAPPQPASPAGFSGRHWSAGTVKLSWQPVSAALGYRLSGPGLPPEGVETSRTSHLVGGLAPGQHTFTIATRYSAGYQTQGLATTVATVARTSGRYRVLLMGMKSHSETRDDPFDFDGKRDEIYAAAYTAVYPYAHSYATGIVRAQTRVYGDANRAPDRIQAGTGSPLGGIKAGDDIPNGFRPVPQPGVAAHNDRFPLLVWEGELQDSGEAVVVHPTVWESDRNASSNFPNWIGWWSTPNGRAILRDRTYTNRTLGPITPIWLGESDTNGFPFQPGMNPGQGLDRPVGFQGFIGISGATPNANSLRPQGLVLTRERIERALGPLANAHLIPVRYGDNNIDLAGTYSVYVQIERLP